MFISFIVLRHTHVASLIHLESKSFSPFDRKGFVWSRKTCEGKGRKGISTLYHGRIRTKMDIFLHAWGFVIS